jgi:hypothetical protein
MIRKPNSSPRSDPETILPHDHDREGRQPYAKEVEDYKHGVVTPPKEQDGDGNNPIRERPKK